MTILASLSSLEVVVQPLSLVWIASITGAVLCGRRKQKLPMSIFIGMAVFLYLVGSPVSKWLISTLEDPYVLESYDHVEAADAVVVLGGAHHPSRYDLSGFNLNASGDRLTTGVDLLKRGKGRAIVLGGSTVRLDSEEFNSGELLKDWVQNQLGGGNILVLPLCANTHAEAEATRELMEEKGWKKIVLVTSGYHMRRASGVFEKAGIEFMPVGCGFEKRGVDSPLFTLFPRTSNVDLFERYLHEIIGLAVYKMRGWV